MTNSADETTRLLLDQIAAGRLPESIPDGIPYASELRRMAESLTEIQRFAVALSQGDLAMPLKATGGQIAGSLKALQASLRHLTWQTQMIAAGRFDQRIEFMGEFSTAFNTMVERLQASYEDLKFLGTHDVLTGLFNRAYFDTELDRLTKGRRFPVGLVMADLDGLKAVNDSLGHAAGDRLLRKAARVFTAAFRADDVAARIGGDEFGVILPEVGEEAAATVLGRVREAEAAMPADGLPLALSLGMAAARSGSEVQEALRKADERMYADKAARKSARS